MKIAFFGTGDFSRNILEKLIKKEELEICLVVSQQDKAVGRKKIITKTQTKILAEKNNIEVCQPKILKNNTDFFDKLKSLNLDFVVVVAYGKIVPKEVLEVSKYGAINIHGSLLPSYRGASPIQEAIKNGDKKTGLTIMYMSEGMDEGDILDKKEITVDIMDKTSDIFKKFEDFGADLLVNTLKKIISGEIKGQKQDDSKASYCSKIEKSDGKINFKKESAEDIYNKFKAYENWPGIYSFYNGKKISFEDVFFRDLEEENKNLKAGDVIKFSDKKEIGIVCKTGVLILNKIKLEGKKETDIISFINGNKEFLAYNFE